MNLREYIDAARNGEVVDDGTKWKPNEWDINVRPGWVKQRNDVTKPNAHHNYRPWKPAEKRLALDPNYTTAEVAEATGRTHSAVTRERSRLRRAARQTTTP